MQMFFIRWIFRDRMNSENDIKIVPMTVGRIMVDNYYDYAKILMDHFKDPRTLFIISSDFCHWGVRYNYRHRADKHGESEIFESIEELDKDGFDKIKTHEL